MGNREYYEKKLEVISTIDDSQIKKPHHIPVAVYIEEADTLYHRALQDKEEMVAAGVARELIEDLPQRLVALIEAEEQWQKEWKTRNKSALEWDKQSPAAYDLRKRLLADFHYAFRKDPDLMAYLKEISQIGAYSGMIQDLNDLSVLGRANARLLEVIERGTVSHDAALSPGDDEIKQSNLMAGENVTNLRLNGVGKSIFIVKIDCYLFYRNIGNPTVG